MHGIGFRLCAWASPSRPRCQAGTAGAGHRALLSSAVRGAVDRMTRPSPTILQPVPSTPPLRPSWEGDSDDDEDSSVPTTFVECPAEITALRALEEVREGHPPLPLHG